MGFGNPNIHRRGRKCNLYLGKRKFPFLGMKRDIVISLIFVLGGAGITRYRRAGGLEAESISDGPTSWEVQDQSAPEYLSGEGRLPGLQTAVPWLCTHEAGG